MSRKFRVVLSPEERATLESMLRSGEAPALALAHARILLKADEGPGGPAWTNEAIQNALDAAPSTIGRVRRRFAETGLAAALYRSPPNRVYPRKVDGEVEAHLVALCCGSPPTGHCRWTLRLLADRIVELQYVESVSHETVRQVLKKTNSSPGGVSSGASRRKPTASS